MRILLVEDDHNLAEALLNTLRTAGFVVDHVGCGKDALLMSLTPNHEIMILDLGLPDMDGLCVLSEIRKNSIKTPALVLTARDRLEDKVTGLDAGADDYLAKPFEVDELMARLRVMERRLGTADSSLINIGEVSLDMGANQVTVEGTLLSLSRREWMLLKALMENAGRILSRIQLENKLYEWGYETNSNAIEVHISNLRKKLPEKFIATVRGVGYIVKK